MAAAYAGHIGVPLVFASGDDKLAKEATEFVPGITTVVTKYATGRSTAKCLSPSTVRGLIAEAAALALTNAATVKPLAVATPVEVEVTFSASAYVDTAMFVPGAERVGARSVRGQFLNMQQAAQFVCTLTRVSV